MTFCDYKQSNCCGETDKHPGSKYIRGLPGNRSLECPRVTSLELQSDVQLSNCFQCVPSLTADRLQTFQAPAAYDGTS